MKFGTAIWGLMVLTGCGYSLRQPESALPGDAPGEPAKVYIPVVDNLTTVTGMEPVFTSTLRESMAGLKGVKVVGDSSTANYILLATITDYSRASVDKGEQTGSNKSAADGGLLNRETTTSDIRLRVQMNARFLKVEPNHLRKVMWDRSFKQEGNFTASRRILEKEGASSAPHINRSREQIQAKIYADAFAQKVVDQIVQDF